MIEVEEEKEDDDRNIFEVCVFDIVEDVEGMVLFPSRETFHMKGVEWKGGINDIVFFLIKKV
jgi:CTP-dependent riboflavin kinase